MVPVSISSSTFNSSHLVIVVKTVVITTITLIAVAFFTARAIYNLVKTRMTNKIMLQIKKQIVNIPRSSSQRTIRTHLDPIKDFLPPIIFRNLKANYCSLLVSLQADLEVLENDRVKKQLFLSGIRSCVEHSIPACLCLSALTKSSVITLACIEGDKSLVAQTLPLFTARNNGYFTNISNNFDRLREFVREWLI
jgi:hypothetical protein